MSSQWGQQYARPQHHNPYQTGPWYTKKRWILPLGGFVVLAIIAGCEGSSENPSTSAIRAAAEVTAQSEPVTTTPSTTDVEAESTTPAAVPTTVDVTKVAVVKPKPKPKPATTKPKPKPKPTKTTKPASKCDPNYSGGCVPIATDVDCAGGSGNGPAYFSGTATVVGTDIYKLDADHDGTACD